MTHTPNSPYKCIDPELINPDTLYTLTLNPDDEWQYFNAPNSEQRYANFFKHISHFILNVMAPTSNVNVFVEYCKAGRLHVHGTIKIRNNFSFFLDTIPRMRKFACYEIDTIKDAHWEEVYIHKCKTLIEPHPRRISTAVLKELSHTIFHTNTIVEDVKPKSKGRPKSKSTLSFD